MKIDEEKLEEMKKNYDPTSEQIFNSTWDLSDSHEDDTMVKKLYKHLSNLNIQSDSEDEDNSSIKTVIENIKKKTFLKPQHRVLPSQGDRCIMKAIPQGWRAHQSLAQQKEEKICLFLFHLCQQQQ